MNNEVFISYSRRDKVFTQKLFEALKAANRTVWADWDSIPAASDWEAEIKEGIEQSETVLFVLSLEWLKSSECRKELEYALKMGKRLIPILHGMVEPQDVPPELGKINWIYMRETDNFDQAFQTLCAAMDTDLEWVKMHTRLQVRAVEWEKKKRDNSFALHGKDLLDGEQFIAQSGGKSPEPTSLQGEYIVASRKDATRRQRLTLIGVSIALVVSVLLGVVAFFQRQAAVAAEATAVAERDHAVSAEATAVAERDRADLNATMAFIRELNAKVLNNLEADPERSLLLALQAVDLTVNAKQPIQPDTEEALRVAVQASRLRQIIRSDPLNDLYAVASSPDGKLVATGSWRGIVKVWSVWKAPSSTSAQGSNTGSLWVEPAFSLPQLDGQALSVAFSPDSKLLAVTSASEILIFETVGGKKLLSLSGHTSLVNKIVFSPDGKLLASASDDGTLKLWETSAGKLVLAFETDVIADQPAIPEYGDQPKAFKSVDFSPDGRWLASARYNGQIYISDVQTGKTLEKIATPENWNRDAIFSPDGKSLAWSDYAGNVALLDLATKNVRFRFRNHKHDASDLAFSPDGALLASAGSDYKVVVRETQTGSLKYTLSGDRQEINALAFSPDGNYIISVNFDAETKFWDALPSALPEAGGFVAQKQPISGLAYSPDGKLLATAGLENLVHLWPSVGGQPIELDAHGNVADLVFSADGNSVAASVWGGDTQLWAVSGKSSTTLNGAGDQIVGLAFSPDGKFLAGGLNTSQAVLWNLQTQKKIFSVPFEYSGRNIGTLAFSPDGKLLAAGSDDYSIKIIDVASGKPLRTLKHDLWVRSVFFSPDGTKLLSGSYDATAVTWDVATGQKILTLSGHTAGVTQAVFSPDGTRIATASADGTAKVWDASNGDLLFTISPGAGIINKVAFSRDGKILATGGEDGLVRFYYVQLNEVLALARARITRSLSEQECITYLHMDKCPETIAKPQAQAPKPTDAAPLKPLAVTLPTSTPDASVLRSGTGSVPVRLEILNKTAEALTVYWVDFDGLEQLLGDLVPNIPFVQDTYSTHAWRVRDQAGNLILEYVDTELPQQKLEIAADKTVVTPAP
jgi:WD40 repeat protein